MRSAIRVGGLQSAGRDSLRFEFVRSKQTLVDRGVPSYTSSVCHWGAAPHARARKAEDAEAGSKSAMETAAEARQDLSLGTIDK